MKSALIAFSFLILPSNSSSQEIVEITRETRDGKLIYDSWCARCHGMDGSGKVEGLELDNPAPDLRDCAFNTSEPRKDWKAVILHGGPARGLSMTMPSWEEAITDEQADAVVDYLKTFCPDRGWPAGELNVRRPLLTSKAFPEDEVLMIPTYQYKREQNKGIKSLTTSFVLERRIGARGQWEVSIPMVNEHFGTGVGDIDLEGKYTIYHDLSDLSIVSLIFEVGLPTGSVDRGFGEGVWKLAPTLAAAQGFGDLFLQSSVTLERPLASGGETELLYHLALTMPLSDEKQSLCPMIEFSSQHILGESGATFFITPQVYLGLVKRGHLALSVGAQIPIAGTKPFEYRIVSFFLWEYKDGGLWW